MSGGRNGQDMERVGWFRPVDYEILKYFYRHDDVDSKPFESGPQLVARAVGNKRNYVSGEMNKLETAGILERPKKGIYRLSDLGRRVVESDLDPDEIPESPR